MAAAVTAIGWVLTVAGLLGALYALAAGTAAVRFFARLMPVAANFPPVTILKPLFRAESGLSDALAGFFRQDYPVPFQIVFGVGDENDTAIPVVRTLIAKYPQVDAVLAIGGRREGANPKIANLAGMMPDARHGVLVLSDSDIGVAPDYLRNVVGTLSQPGVGAVSCCYAGAPLSNTWSKLAAQGIDYHFLPSVILGTALGLAKPCFGSTIALTRATLDKIGGFDAFRDRLADDYEIGFAVRALGHDVALPPFAVTHTCTESSASELFHHELRWARTIRAVDPLGFAGSGVTHALPLGLMGAALLGFSWGSLGILACILAARVYVKVSVDKALSRPGTGLWLFPLRDMLSFAVFVAAFFAGRVDWRGSRFRVHAGGDIARE